MRTLIIIVFLILLVSISSEKEPGDLVWYKYAQTGCADKWGANSNSTDKEISDAVKVYLKAQFISIHEIQVGYDASLAEMCKSCFCHTGKFILVSASIGYETKLLEIGFGKVENSN